jgi:hypothetical protein
MWPGRPGSQSVSTVDMTLQPPIPHRVPALTADGDGLIDDAPHSRVEGFRHGYNYIDNPVDQSESSSEEESDNELHSDELDHDDGCDRVEDEDWEIVEKGKQTSRYDIFLLIMISERLYQTI